MGIMMYGAKGTELKFRAIAKMRMMRKGNERTIRVQVSGRIIHSNRVKFRLVSQPPEDRKILSIFP